MGKSVRGMKAGLALALMLALIFAVPHPAQAATKIQTDLSEQDGYGRLVFAWPGAMPGYKADLVAGVLVLHFDAPFDVDLDNFMRMMPRYVALARQDDDHKALRLALKADFTTHAQVAEGKLYLDLLPDGWTGVAPALPADVLARMAAAEELKKAAALEASRAQENGVVAPVAETPKIKVRVGQHDGFTRLVFDWNQPVLYALVQKDGQATISFDRDAQIDLAPIRVDAPPYLTTIKSVSQDGRLAVILKLKEGVSVVDFREDLGIVLDLKPSSPAAPVAENQAPPQDLPAPKTDRKTDHADTHEDHASGETVHAGKPAAAEDAKLAEPLLPKKTKDRVAVTSDIADDHADIVFDWETPVGAAVFVRGDALWMVFDETMPLDTTALAIDFKRQFGDAKVMALDGGVAMVVKLPNKALVSVSEEGTQWRVSAGAQLTNPGRPITLTRSWRETGEGLVSFDMRGARKVLAILDPVVRDRLLVATSRGPVQALQTQRGFVEFQALQTMQGLAIQPIADDVNVSAAPDAVLVSRAIGLTLSGDMPGTNTVPGGNIAASSSPAYIDFAGWKQTPVKGFTEGRKYHMSRIAAATMETVGRMRLDYARFLLAYRMGPEALTVLNQAREAEPGLEYEPQFRSMRGVAAVLAQRFPEAIKDLSVSELMHDGYASAWRGVARVGLYDFGDAKEDFALAMPVLTTIEPDIQAMIRAKAAMAAVARNEPALAQSFMSRVPQGAGDRRTKAELQLVRAQLSEAMARPADADHLYDVAIAEGYPPVAARAMLGKAMLAHKSGRMKEADYAKELERLDLRWRGDDFELTVLRKLAELKLKQQDIVGALKVMRTASKNFPSNDETRLMYGRMSDLFADFFISGKAEKMPAVQALAFFYDLQDLTPIGAKGDEMIRHLAEQLVAVDLLPQAEALLKYQIDNRIHGSVAKAQVAARLASIYLLDRQAEKALGTLRDTRQEGLPDDLAMRRRLIEVRALAEMKQTDFALDLLSSVEGRVADELRADILWDGQRWSDCGTMIEALLGDSWKKEGPLDDATRFDVMRGAIAFSLAGDEAGLSRLRTKFGDAMRQSADASAFDVVTDPIVKQGTAFREMASKIASVNTLDRFVASLRKEDEAPAPAVN